MAACRFHDTGLGNSQKRINAFFPGDAARDGGGVFVPEDLAIPDLPADLLVVRFHRLGEIQIGEGIFVGAIDPGGIWQPREFTEGVMHLPGRAFKQPAAAREKQGITDKHHALGVISNGPGGMARHVKDLKVQVQALQIHHITLLEGMGPSGYLFVRRAVYGYLVVREYPADTPYMIRVMMGNQDGGWVQPIRFDAVNYGSSIAWVYNCDLAVRFMNDEPDIIIPEGGNRFYFYHNQTCCNGLSRYGGGAIMTKLHNRVTLWEDYGMNAGIRKI